MSEDATNPGEDNADDRAKSGLAEKPQPVPDDSTDESAAGEEDPGASLDSVVNPLPPANRPS